MIHQNTYSIEWINEVKAGLGRKADPKLVEKVIYAFSLLESLSTNGIDLVFKGGTFILLASEKPMRFSIDVDIITLHPEKDLLEVLNKIVKKHPFYRFVTDNNRKHSSETPVGHYKLFYKSVVDAREEPILLDVLFTKNQYPVTQAIDIAHPWLKQDGIPVKITAPTFEGILGDKLTAFAPKTTGILYSKNRPVEIIKQLFDIAFLFDNITDLSVVKASFLNVAKDEIGYRNLKISWAEVLNDTIEACFVLSLREEKSDEFKHLHTGIRNIANFIMSRFAIDEAIAASSKVAYISTLLKNDEIISIERYGNPALIKDWTIENSRFSKLNKLKKANPEAFFYWKIASDNH